MSKRILFIALCAVFVAGLLSLPTASVLASVGPPDISVQANNYISAQPSFGFASAQSFNGIIVANGECSGNWMIISASALAPPGILPAQALNSGRSVWDIDSVLAKSFANVIDRASTFSVLTIA